MSSTYLKKAIGPFERLKTIRRLIALIEKSGVEFDAIAFRGISGALIAPSIGDKLNKPIVLCRKKDGHHSSLEIEYIGQNIKKYIIIDDLIETGTTIEAIVKAMEKEGERFIGPMENPTGIVGIVKSPICTGIFLYNDCDWESSEFTSCGAPPIDVFTL